MGKKENGDIEKEDGELKMKSFKKEKKMKKQKRDEQEDVAESDENILEVNDTKKEKKTKKQKRDEQKDIAESDENDIDSKKDKKKQRKPKNADVTVCEDAMAAVETMSESEEVKEVSVVEQPVTESVPKEDLAHYDKKMKKAFPSREEKARRDNQKKMQAYVQELRDQGLDEKEIKKMKNKVNKKLKFIGRDTQFNEVVGHADMTITCRDCGSEFIFSSREQTFYLEKGYDTPVRCKECAAAKKVRMSHFDR